MTWDVEYTEPFEVWWDGLDEEGQEDVYAKVELLRRFGPQLPYPHTSGIRESRHGHMRELRVQSAGRPIRILYAFDPRRCAILLLAGDKTGDNRWYEMNVPKADALYDEHLQILKRERNKNEDA